MSNNTSQLTSKTLLLGVLFFLSFTSVQGSPKDSVTTTPPKTKKHQVWIKTLQETYRWNESDYPMNLVVAADLQTKKPDGYTSNAELEKYILNPKDLQFFSSRTISKMRSALSEQEIKPWEEKTWIPDQKLAALKSQIASLTKENDLLTPPTAFPCQDLPKNYMRICLDRHRKNPQWVSYLLSSYDIAEKVDTIERSDKFRADPAAGSEAVVPKDYTNSGYDRGHQKPAGDSPNVEAMEESFLMTNMSPQAPKLNQGSWRMLELAVRELVVASGAEAIIFTGNLYLDGLGNPLGDEEISWIPKDIPTKEVAVPTHCYKAFLLIHPDGRVQTDAYVIPNSLELPTKEEEMFRVLKIGRATVDQVETLIQANLFHTLKTKVAKKLESNSTQEFFISDPLKFKAAAKLWSTQAN